MKPFKSYDEYMANVFDCVNRCLHQYLEGMKGVYANGQGGYKNVLYPDLEVASDSTREQMLKVSRLIESGDDEASEDSVSLDEEPEAKDDEMDDFSDIFGSDDDLMDIFSSFGNTDDEDDSGSSSGSDRDSDSVDTSPIEDIAGHILEIQEAAAAAVEAGISMPFYTLVKKMEFDPFTIFCFACGILSSTQTDYAGEFQIVNENGGLSTPTIESAGKLYYGDNYSITGAYGDMSVCLEQMQPVLDLRVVPSMPFSTAVSPDKRIIDYLFGKNPMKLDENYSRFLRRMKSLTISSVMKMFLNP